MPGVTQSQPGSSRSRRRQSTAYNLTARRDLAGFIAFLPLREETNEDPDGDDGHFGHPVVLLSKAHVNGKVDVLSMTSFGKTNLSIKHPHNENVRRHYLPISPSPTHPDNGILLKLRHDSPPLRVPSYINTENLHKVNIVSLRPYYSKDHKIRDHFLSRDSYLVLNDYHHGIYDQHSPPAYALTPAWETAVETPPPRYEDLPHKEATTGLYPPSTSAPSRSSSRHNNNNNNNSAQNPHSRSSITPAPLSSSPSPAVRPSRGSSVAHPNPERQRLLDHHHRQHQSATPITPPPRYGATASSTRQELGGRPSVRGNIPLTSNTNDYYYYYSHHHNHYHRYVPRYEPPQPRRTTTTTTTNQRSKWSWLPSFSFPSFSRSSSSSSSFSSSYSSYPRSSSSSSSNHHWKTFQAVLVLAIAALVLGSLGYGVYRLGLWIVHEVLLLLLLGGAKMKAGLRALGVFFGKTIPGKFGELGRTVRMCFRRFFQRIFVGGGERGRGGE